MQALLEAVRAQCPKAVWSQGEALAERGTIYGLRVSDAELAVRVALPDGQLSPLITLHVARATWRCACPRGERGCVHAAAAVRALGAGNRRERDVLAEPGHATVAYAFSEQDGLLALQRLVRRGELLLPLGGRLAAAERPRDLMDVEATPADLQADIVLRAHTHGPLAAPFVSRLFPHLRECGDVTLNGEPVRIGMPVHVVSARLIDTDDGFLVEAGPTPRLERRYRNGAVLTSGKLCAVADTGLSERDLQALRAGRRFAFGDAAELVNTVLPALRERLPVKVESARLSQAEPMAPRIAFSSEGVGDKVQVLATLVYGDPPSAQVVGDKLTYLGGPLPLRDKERETSLRRALWRATGLEAGEKKLMDASEAVALSGLAASLGEQSFAGRGPGAFETHGTLQAELDTTDGRFGLTFRTPDGREGDADAVLNAWRGGAPLVPLLDGGFAELPTGWLERHGQLVLDLLRAREPQSGALPKASLLDLARLLEELNRPPPPALDGLRALLDETRDGLPPAQLPPGLHGTLRDYQLDGVRWLQFMSRAEIGALLADDMGLGKTVQALCALTPPALVVCPASVLFNWNEEIRKFRPDLRASTYHQPGRRIDPDADVTLTTYAILRLDRDVLSERPWDTVVLDEAHMIKNPQSQVAQAAFALRARFRVALTGTPVENRLEDLWSQMHFLNRGLLGGRRDFQERYAGPIAAGDAERQERLRDRVRPLVLRRLKREVAAELPPRTDIVLHCELSERERTLYDAVRAAAQRDVVAQLTAGQGVMAALEALLRLRQACCHPALLPGERADDSSKLRVLRENLEEVLSEGHKALIFSQWTSLLDLVEPGLDAVGVRYVRLDGSTRNRQEVVDRFQTDPAVPVLLLSLKAGGVGLNLTAADHVFLLDPWWNPAVEDQAADRAHRIGQDRPVFVHRLVAEDTVEERILELQQKKRALAAAATESGPQAASLTREDLLGLLEA